MHFPATSLDSEVQQAVDLITFPSRAFKDGGYIIKAF